MPSPAALDTLRTGTPDGSAGLLISSIVAQETGSEIPAGVALSDRIASSASADRAVTAADGTTPTNVDNGSTFAGASGANLKDVNNRGALAVWATFEATTDSATVRIVFYDAANTPLFVSPLLTLVPISTFKHEGPTPDVYLSEVQLVDTYGASKFRPWVVSKGDGTNDLNVYAHPI